MSDPWRFQRWAFETQTGNPVRKAVLSMLAMMADATTGRCEAKQDTLARGVEASERSVRAHLRALEEMGLIARRPQFRRDRGRRGDEFLLLAPGVDEWPDGAPIPDGPASPTEGPAAGHPEGDAAGSPGMTFRGAPERSGTPPRVSHVPGKNDHKGTTARNDHASEQEENARDPREQIPDDFPAELRPHAREVMRVLVAVSEQHPQARRVWPAAVARVVMAYPRHPLVATAHALAVWAVDPPRPVRDVVATYRTFLARERELATVERLPGQDPPPAGAVAPSLRAIPGGRMSNADVVEAQIRALNAASSDHA